MPQSSPPNRVTMRGPYLSTNQPSIGTSHVSVTTKIVKATWIAARSHPCRSCIGLTKKVQPYCRLAIMHMQITPNRSCSQGFGRSPPPLSLTICPSAFLGVGRLGSCGRDAWRRLIGSALLWYLGCQIFKNFTLGKLSTWQHYCFFTVSRKAASKLSLRGSDKKHQPAIRPGAAPPITASEAAPRHSHP